jgi:hypothetical protein
MTTIASIIDRDLSKPIEEVVKVSQTEDKTVYDEINEYVATDRIKEQYAKVLSPIADFRHPTERVGIWVSGFFGSGKSSFIKILGYVLGRRPVVGEPAGSLFLRRLEADAPHDPKVQKIALPLNVITNQLPMLVLMFDVQVDLPVGMAGDPLARVMYGNLLRALDYEHEDYDIAELEIELEQEGRLAEFARLCARAYGGQVPGRVAKPPITAGDLTPEEYGVWRAVRRSASRLDRAGRLLHELDPATYPENNTWTTLKRRQPDLTVGRLVERTFDLTARRLPGHGVVYVMDEVGQYVAHNTARLENLRAIVEQFGQESKNRVGRLKNAAPSPVWVVISSQEKLEEVVSATGDKRVEMAKVQDRFPIQVDMAPADIHEVATRRVLAKTPAGAVALGKLYDQHSALLKTHSKLERTGRSHDARREEFIRFYPYLPHFIDLSIEIVSGIRGRGDAPRHIGGSNRTIIKQAYEMLAHPRIGLKDKSIGALVTLDRVYDLLEGNLPTETRQEIDAVLERSDLSDLWPGRVAKALALLQHVRDLPRTEANLAALLYDRLGDDSPLGAVRDALNWLSARQFVGQDENGWKLLSVAEKNWETERDSYQPSAREQNNILEDALKRLFDTPALNAYRHLNLRTFRVRAEWDGRLLVSGDHIRVQLRLADGPEAVAGEVERSVIDSQNEPKPKSLFWIAVRGDELDEAVIQVARSNYMIQRYSEEQTQGRLQPAEGVALEDERRKLETNGGRLSARLAEALAGGRGVFDSLRRTASDFGHTVEEVFRGYYAFAVPELYPKLEMGVRSALKNDNADKILKAANLNGLPGVFYGSPTGFDLVTKREGGKFAVNNDAPLIKEIRDYVSKESGYGNKVTGKGLEDHFGRPPYGWESRTLMLSLAAALRGGALVVTYQGHRYRDHLDPQVHEVFDGPSAFRGASFAPRTSIKMLDLVSAARRYESLTGDSVDIEETAIAAAYQAMAAQEFDRLRTVDAVIRANLLPGREAVNEYSEMLVGLRNDASDDIVIRMAQEGASFEELRRRAQRIADGAEERGIARLRKMRQAASQIWPLLLAEGVATEINPDDVAALSEFVDSEAAYGPAPEMDKLARQLEDAYIGFYTGRHADRAAAYAAAVDAVRVQADWNLVGEEVGEGLLRALRGRDHEADLAAESLTCRVCGASPATLAADLAAAGKLQSDALTRLREAAAPPEVTTERVRLSAIIGHSPSLSTSKEVDELVKKMTDHLYPLVEAGIRVILE